MSYLFLPDSWKLDQLLLPAHHRRQEWVSSHQSQKQPWVSEKAGTGSSYKEWLSLTKPCCPSDSILATCLHTSDSKPFLPLVCAVLILGHHPPPHSWVFINFQLKDFNIGLHRSVLLSNFLDTIFSEPVSGKGTNTAEGNGNRPLSRSNKKKELYVILRYCSYIEKIYISRKVKGWINTLFCKFSYAFFFCSLIVLNLIITKVEHRKR